MQARTRRTSLGLLAMASMSVAIYLVTRPSPAVEPPPPEPLPHYRMELAPTATGARTLPAGPEVSIVGLGSEHLRVLVRSGLTLTLRLVPEEPDEGLVDLGVSVLEHEPSVASAVAFVSVPQADGSVLLRFAVPEPRSSTTQLIVLLARRALMQNARQSLLAQPNANGLGYQRWAFALSLRQPMP
jgi:hypothetical protein